MGEAGVADFDYEVGGGENIGELLLGGGDVAGVPVDGLLRKRREGGQKRELWGRDRKGRGKGSSGKGRSGQSRSGQEPRGEKPEGNLEWRGSCEQRN